MVLYYNGSSISMVNPFALDLDDCKIREKLSKVGSMNHCSGMRYFPEPYNLTLDLLQSYINNKTYSLVSDLGIWFIFGHIDMLRECITAIGDYITKTKDKGLRKVVLKEVEDGKSILSVSCRPFYDTKKIKKCLMLLQELLEPVLERYHIHGITWFFKPVVLSQFGINKDAKIKSYIFKSRMNLSS